MILLARHLLLAALLLRALVPLGWMPSAQLGQAAWIICTADGQIQHGSPGNDETRRQHQPCAFAATHAMAAPQGDAFAAPLLQAAVLDALPAAAPLSLVARFTPQAPRAPPISA